MPYIPYDDDELKKKSQEDGSSAPSLTNSSSVINAGDSAPNATQKPESSSGTFTNLNQYLDANRDQSLGMADKIGTTIESQGTNTRKAIDTNQNDFNSAADKGTITNLGGAKDDASSIVGAARTGSYQNQPSDTQVNRFSEVSNAAYKGPKDNTGLSSYLDAQKNLEKSNQHKQNTGSDDGRMSLLEETYGRPNYSQGSKLLDNGLISQNEQSKARIQNAGNSLSDLQGLSDGALTNSTNTANQRTNDSISARQFAQNTLQGQRGERAQEVDADLSNKETHWQDEYNQYNDLLSKYKGGDLDLNQAQADRLGVGAASGQGVYNMLNGVSASTYLDQKAFDANKVVSKDQYAQLSALDKLGSQFGSANQSRFSQGIDNAETLNAQNAFDASRFGSGQKQATTDFDNYSGKTNFSGEGSGKQTYKDGGWDGNNKHDVYADTTISANLKDYLNSGKFTFNNEDRTEDRAGIGPDGIRTGNNYADLITRPGGALVDGISNGVNGLLGRETSGSKEAVAQRNAQTEANSVAQGNYFQNLNAILDGQGYKNRIKIKG